MLSRWIWILSLLLVITGLPVSAETLTGKVVGVHDGDTLTLRVVGNQPVKVRLAGLDAPELDQTYGQKAKRALSALTFDKSARVESPGPDKYGRTLGTAYRTYPFPPELEALEAQAQATKRGLWTLQPDQRCPPWDWRHKEPCGSPIVAGQAAEPPEPPASEGPCGAKRTCGEMTSCEEARFYLTQCGISRLDKD